MAHRLVKTSQKISKAYMKSAKEELDHTGLEYHPHAKTLPGEELNCFYLDVLEQMAVAKWIFWKSLLQGRAPDPSRIFAVPREYYE